VCVLSVLTWAWGLLLSRDPRVWTSRCTRKIRAKYNSPVYFIHWCVNDTSHCFVSTVWTCVRFQELPIKVAVLSTVQADVCRQQVLLMIVWRKCLASRILVWRTEPAFVNTLYIHTYIPTYTHIRTFIHTHHTHTYIHTHTHTHASCLNCTSYRHK
jgi:hypothetical protein